MWFATTNLVGEACICEPEKILAIEWHALDDLPTPLFTGVQNALDKGLLERECL